MPKEELTVGRLAEQLAGLSQDLLIISGGETDIFDPRYNFIGEKSSVGIVKGEKFSVEIVEVEKDGQRAALVSPLNPEHPYIGGYRIIPKQNITPESNTLSEREFILRERQIITLDLSKAGKKLFKDQEVTKRDFYVYTITEGRLPGSSIMSGQWLDDLIDDSHDLFSENHPKQIGYPNDNNIIKYQNLTDEAKKEEWIEKLKRTAENNELLEGKLESIIESIKNN